jgi:hypothetical protein
MNNLKLEKIFRALTYLSFATIFITGTICSIQESNYSGNYNNQILITIVIIGLISLTVFGLLWDLFFLINKSHSIYEEKKVEIEQSTQLMNYIAKNDALNIKNKNIPVKKKLLSLLFIIWFIASLLLMMKYKNNIKIELMILSQYAIIFIIIIILGNKRK